MQVKRPITINEYDLQFQKRTQKIPVEEQHTS